MVLRVIEATQAKPGSVIMIEGEAYTVKTNDKSKSGKHGAAKCRIEALNIFTGKKKVLACSGAERFEVPLVEKRKAQVLSIENDLASVMDLESYETISITFPDELKEELEPEKQVEYWTVEGKKSIMRVL
jgi:translation initiation factor 5A